MKSSSLKVGLTVALASGLALIAWTPPSKRAGFAGRIILALTANPYYALNGARPGMRLASLPRRLRAGKPLHLGRSFWYLVPGKASEGRVSE